MTNTTKLKVLRIALDPSAADAYEGMVKKLKEIQPTIKVSPSQFVSFLVFDFLNTYFEKDRDVLISEFFDSDAYYQFVLKKAKGQNNFDELMAEALTYCQKVRGKRRRRSKIPKSEIESPINEITK